INPVNEPGRHVGGNQEFESVHRGLLPSGRLVVAAAPAPTKDSMASARSTPRFKSSSRYRDQQTRNAKKRKASQRTRGVWSMRGSMEPPPPITGCGCWVRKNQIEKYTRGTSSAPKTARAAAMTWVCALVENFRSTR